MKSLEFCVHLIGLRGAGWMSYLWSCTGNPPFQDGKKTLLNMCMFLHPLVVRQRKGRPASGRAAAYTGTAYCVKLNSIITIMLVKFFMIQISLIRFFPLKKWMNANFHLVAVLNPKLVRFAVSPLGGSKSFPLDIKCWWWLVVFVTCISFYSSNINACWRDWRRKTRSWGKWCCKKMTKGFTKGK